MWKSFIILVLLVIDCYTCINIVRFDWAQNIRTGNISRYTNDNQSSCANTSFSCLQQNQITRYAAIQSYINIGISLDYKLNCKNTSFSQSCYVNISYSCINTKPTITPISLNYTAKYYPQQQRNSLMQRISFSLSSICDNTNYVILEVRSNHCTCINNIGLMHNMYNKIPFGPSIPQPPNKQPYNKLIILTTVSITVFILGFGLGFGILICFIKDKQEIDIDIQAPVPSMITFQVPTTIEDTTTINGETSS